MNRLLALVVGVFCLVAGAVLPSAAAYPALLAMGGAGVALGDSVFFLDNPAAVAWQQGQSAVLEYGVGSPGRNGTTMLGGYFAPDEGWGAGAITYSSLHSAPDASATTAHGELRYTLAHQLRPGLALGGAVRLVNDVITPAAQGAPQITDNGLGFDAGLLWQMSPRFAAGLSVLDLNGTPLNSGPTTISTPVDVRAGATFAPNDAWRIAAAVSDAAGQTTAGTAAHAGVSWQKGALTLCAGASLPVNAAASAVSFSAGGSYAASTFTADLAWVDGATPGFLAGLTARF